MPGLEPGKHDPESCVLPLHHIPITNVTNRQRTRDSSGLKTRLLNNAIKRLSFKKALGDSLPSSAIVADDIGSFNSDFVFVLLQVADYVTTNGMVRFTLHV